MDYKRIYESLIEKGKNRTLTEYSELHHIIPRCIYGNNDKTNLVRLTPEEHYLAHQLLIKIYPNNRSLVKAARMMIPNRKGNKLYGWLRRRYSVVQSYCQSGSSNNNYGTFWIYNKILKESKRCDGEIPVGWEKGRVINWDRINMKIRSKKVIGWNENKIEKDKKKDLILQEKLYVINEHYKLYCLYGFKKFVEMSGYNKTQANLIQSFKKFIPAFKSQQGKKRGI